ncbi:hypothetical protein B0O99DRAFT_686422 [Bisporella sp. PMI_857]|nr:hypothetical protein B0O99DRAFT_686422 [Bisporella sp. PMI_857]
MRVKGTIVEVVIEAQLELPLLLGLHKSNTVPDTSTHLTIQPNSYCHSTIDHKVFDELFIPRSIIGTEDIQDNDLFMLKIFLKFLSIKRSPDSFDREWHTKASLPTSNNNLQKIRPTDLEEFQSGVESTLSSRTTIATRNYLVIAPDVTQPGDLICMPSGCDAPVIHRQQLNGTYTFIGDAFTGSDQSSQDMMYE